VPRMRGGTPPRGLPPPHHGCRHRGCRRHHRNFGSVRNKSETVPGSSEWEENTSEALNSSSVPSTSATAADCRSEPGADL